MNSTSYYQKYLKYKHKYLSLKSIYGGSDPNDPSTIALKNEYLRKKINPFLKKVRENVVKRNSDLEAAKCNKIEKYVNIDLNINIIGTSQPMYELKTYDDCFNLLNDNNVVLYITFNQKNHKKATEIEKKYFNKKCVNKLVCKFVSIPIRDYTAPTSGQLIYFWKLLDNFHNKTKKINNKYNVLMHCTAGHGRTGFMIVSYIWLNKIKQDKSFSPFDSSNHTSINDVIADYDSTNYQKYEFIKNRKIMEFLMTEIKKYSYDSYNEVFNYEESDTEMTPEQIGSLFINRIRNFIIAYKKYIIISLKI
jgi:protein tyrosine phosphatase